ncbi:MAG: cysteine hydrolase [Ruminococcaceae bacterium]|nr:cysteine hydrolase [Oscillospiraceae bacterium]
MNVLIVVDMQNDFIDGALGTKEAVQIVPAVREKIDAARNRGDAVIFTRDTHEESYLSTQEGAKLPVPHCIRGTHGWQITDALPVEDSVVIDKPTFGSKELGEYLVSLAPEGIELVGLCTDICVISNALLAKAFLPEVPVAVDAACCAGVTPQSHENALAAMACCQIEVVNHG